MDCSIDPAGARPFGLSQDLLEAAVAASHYSELLRTAVDTSRRYFNFYTAHRPHTINYPWVLSRLVDLPTGAALLDIGAGVSPVPFCLAERGMVVDCVDSGDFERKPPAGEDWNEWGFFDYGALHANLRAFNVAITDFAPQRAYDAIYSTSVIAHIPSREREETVRRCSVWLKPGGRVVFAVDLIPATDTLWNLGGSEETPEEHGTVQDLEAQLTQLGFAIDESSVTRGLAWSRTDLYFLAATKPREDDKGGG